MTRLPALGALLVTACILLPACTPHGLRSDLAAERDYPLRHNLPLTDHGGPVVPVTAAPGPEAGLRKASLRNSVVAPARPLPAAPPLSPGDRVRVAVHLLEDLDGLYDVDIDGSLRFPHIDPLPVAGRSSLDAADMLKQALLDREFLRPELAHVSIQVQLWAPVDVMVEGAVFSPGSVTVNVRKPEEKAQKSVQVSGDFPGDRLLPAALRAAGGVRMDAAVDQVLLVRDGVAHRVSLVEMIEGGEMPFAPLMAGDRVIVPSSGTINERLARPSGITPPGIRVFLSNQTTPVFSNSQANVGRDATSLPYGSTLLTALISANCVGGTATTNSARWAVLMTRNPLTGEPHVIERSIEDLLRDPNRPDLNPALQPNDGVACYDSGVTNLRDIARTLVDILSPLSIFRGLP